MIMIITYSGKNREISHAHREQTSKCYVIYLSLQTGEHRPRPRPLAFVIGTGVAHVRTGNGSAGHQSRVRTCIRVSVC